MLGIVIWRVKFGVVYGARYEDGRGLIPPTVVFSSYEAS